MDKIEVNIQYIRGYLDKYMQENRIGPVKMAEKMGIRYNHLYSVLQHKRGAGAKFLAGLIRIGMPLDEILLNSKENPSKL